MWTKLQNPKPPKPTDCPDNGVRFSARQLKRRKSDDFIPWVRIQIGKDAARKGSFSKTIHLVHILIGEKEENGNVAIVCDDETGKFEAKKQTDGSYTLAISAGAAKDRFAVKFDTFAIQDAKAIGNGKGPAFITFSVPTYFLSP